LPKKTLFGYWSEADLRIIPEILVPIENKLRQVSQNPPLDNQSNLLILYRDSKQ